jgi:Ca2+-transporting ATPase
MWFSQPIEEILKELSVDPAQGLTDAEAKIRFEKSGPNKLRGQKQKSIIVLFLAQLNDWLIYILFAAVIITLFMKEYADVIIISLVIIINAVLGVIQEVRAGKAIDALRKLSFPKAVVLRNGNILNIDSEKVVPGDILILTTGQFIPADVRLIESVNLQIEESALTGESVPSEKDASYILTDPKTPLGDRMNAAFMSTIVSTGRGVGVVVRTGMDTEIGKIADLINNEVKSKTPLEIRLDELGKTIGKFALGICVVIFVIAMLQGRDLAEMFLMSVSLAVAAIPEGLAAIVAVVLSVGVTIMAKKNAIIKKLPAVETLGSVNIICSDKTGTLTQNKMRVTKYFNLCGEVTVEKGRENIAAPDAELLAKAMILCSDATFGNDEGTGDPTEIALLLFGDDLGTDRNTLNSDSKRINEFPFDSDRKLMSVLSSENGSLTVYTKGAIGNLLKISTHVIENGKIISITEDHIKKYLEATSVMSNQALRTLGVAFKRVDSEIGPAEMENNLVFIGIVGMIDPPRPEVKTSIQNAKAAGITSIMITGDHKNTAFAIALELGMAENIDQAITGHEIDELSDEEFIAKIMSYRVFARVSPEHKVKIVRALKSHGNIVSMTGDGVNDAPALHAADIGVAMGITGTDVAKGASDLILTDDNYSTIVSAIEEGRNIYNNIKKSVIFLLTCNLGEVITVFFTLLIGWKAPLIATQLLWINLITDSFPAVALGMDPGSPDVMKEKPRNSKESFFAGGSGIHVILGGCLIGALTIFAFWYGYYEHESSPFDESAPAGTVEYARTMAFMVLVISQLFFALALRSKTKSVFRAGILANKYLTASIILGVLLQLLVIGIPFMQRAFNLQMLDLRGWIVASLLGLIPLFADEIFKIFIRAHRRKSVILTS